MKRKKHIFRALIPGTKAHQQLIYWAFYAPSHLPLTSILPSQREFFRQYVISEKQSKNPVFILV